MTKTVTVRIPSNIPLNKLPWRDYPQALADLIEKGASPKIVLTESSKENHLA